MSVVPALEPAKSLTPATDSGFLSGHSAEAVRDSLAMAYLVPSASRRCWPSSGLGRTASSAGMHSPLDVMGAAFGTAVYGLQPEQE